ncbi:hypothetical protein [Flavonifractor sp. An100]|uniref:hypothetical protein n=1 Tax=Flavonifractor sp. An100 TaxID=1965538 RepID=UPI001179CE08|nr:hypothetical protein [Flavonifractor sp. An100]
MGKFTKNSYWSHGFDVNVWYFILVTSDSKNISHFSLSFTTHTGKRPRVKNRGLLLSIFPLSMGWDVNKKFTCDT